MNRPGSAMIQAMAQIDRAGSKGVVHHRTASRKISRLSKKLHRHSASPLNGRPNTASCYADPRPALAVPARPGDQKFSKIPL